MAARRRFLLFLTALIGWSGKGMILDLDENEIGALVSILDMALGAYRLQARAAVNLIFDKLSSAKLAEAAAIEAAKLVETENPEVVG